MYGNDVRLRRPGGFRSPPFLARLLSALASFPRSPPSRARPRRPSRLQVFAFSGVPCVCRFCAPSVFFCFLLFSFSSAVGRARGKRRNRRGRRTFRLAPVGLTRRLNKVLRNKLKKKKNSFSVV